MKEAKYFTGKICPYCEKRTKFVDSSIIYGQSYGMIYYCKPCDAYVGVHKGTKEALGRLANSQLRYWKKKAHAYFDPLWERKMKAGFTKATARSAAYKWLSNELNVPLNYTHIGMFDIEQCQKVVQLCKRYHKQL